MNKYVKEFFHRGLIFGGFGPIILGIVFAILEGTVDGFTLGGGEVLVAVISTYVIAFVQAGASVFNQIEHWPITKSTLCHFSSLFLVYSIGYIINAWIPFEPVVLLIFCLVFIAVYLTVWLTVYLSTKAYTKKLNEKIHPK